MRDDRAHAGHRLTAEKLAHKLDVARRTGSERLYLHERDLSDAVLEQVFSGADPAPLPRVKFLQLQSNPRFTSRGLSLLCRVAPDVLPALEEIVLSYTGVADLSPLAGLHALREISAIVEKPHGAARLAELPHLCALELSDRVPQAELEALRARRGLSIRLFPYDRGTPDRFDEPSAGSNP